MAVSVEQICNMALLKIGSDTITTISEDTKQARLCNAIFSLMRDEVLRQHPWNFAMARAQLAIDVNDSPDFEFSYQYAVPDDFLRLVRLYKDGGRFKIEGSNILTDAATLDIIYISQMEDPTQWDPLFREAFATRLAAEISFGITGSNTLAQTLMQEYAQKLQKAKTVDAQENYSDGFVVDDLTNSRRSSTYWDNLGLPE